MTPPTLEQIAREPNDHRSPLAKARDDFLSTEEGRKLCDPSTLGLPKHQAQYLTNRITRAFLLGADAGERITFLQTAAKQPEGADWAENAAKELADELFSHRYGGSAANYATEKAAFTSNIAAIVRRHAPRPDEQQNEAARTLISAISLLEHNGSVAESIGKQLRDAVAALLAGQVAGGERPDLNRTADGVGHRTTYQPQHMWGDGEFEGWTDLGMPTKSKRNAVARMNMFRTTNPPAKTRYLRISSTIEVCDLDAAMRPAQPERGQGQEKENHE